MPNFKKDRSKFTMKGFSPFNSGTPYKQDDKPVPKPPAKSNKMTEANEEERRIMAQMDALEAKMKNLDKNSKEYKDLHDKHSTLDNQLWQYD